MNQPGGTQSQQTRRRAQDTSSVRYSDADKLTIANMMRGNNTPKQAERVAQILPGNRTGNAILTMWRRMEGSYGHPHPYRWNRAVGTAYGGNGGGGPAPGGGGGTGSSGSQ